MTPRAPRIAAGLPALVMAAVVCLPLEVLHAEDATSGSVSEELFEAPISDGDRDHWAFRPLKRPDLPAVRDASWSRNPIDRFVLARLEDEGLRPAPPSASSMLVRRLALDLVGLPPTPDELRAYLADDAVDAFEQRVDALLASPAYGERWAQYWLDLARFAETDGFEFDKPRPTAWRYRDWVIAAWNAGMPYDEFIQRQIAGDLLEPDNPDAAIATAFCVAGPDMPDINLQQERKHNLLTEMTATLGAVVLGLQVGCAQCHNHMFDPISQADFYRMRAFFRSAVHVERDQSITVLAERKAADDQPSRMLIRGDWRRPGPQVEPAYLRIANPQASAPDEASPVPARLQFARWLTSPDHPLTARVLANRLWQHHFGRGLCDTPSDFGTMGDFPSHPELLDWLACELVAGEWQIKPLQKLIVTSATYRQSSYADAESSAQAAWNDSWKHDPDAALLSRYPRRRLEGEIVRDAMYAVSASLDRRMGGPGVRPPLPQEMVDTLLRDQWNVSERTADHYRRSIYVFARRNLRYPMFAALDRPPATASCAARPVSTTAPQSLTLLNSAITLDAARRLAGRVWEQAAGDLHQQAQLASTLAFSRVLEEDELRDLTEFLKRQQVLLSESGRPPSDLALPITHEPIADEDSALGAALTDLCLALLNASEFLYID
jgi:hypothetical protein